MKKLGKLTALWLCWELWDWLAKNPNKRKNDWPKWSKVEGVGITARVHFEPYGKINMSCFACHYGSICQNCIVPILRGDGHCGLSGRNFNKWRDAQTPKTHKKYARIIATSAYKEYVRLGGRKRK